MIVGAAVCPGAPFLVAGVADALAERLSDVGAACARSLVLLPDADTVVLLTCRPGSRAPAQPGWRSFAPGSVIDRTSIVRSDRGASDADPAGPVVGDPAVGSIVGAALLAAHRPVDPVLTIETHGDPSGAASAAAAAIAGMHRVALLVIADGSACHGDDAPGRRDDRSAPFDAALAAALAAGDPADLARVCSDRGLGAELMAGVDPLAVLADLTAARPPAAAEVLYAGAPVGVGYLVASWRWVDA